MHPLVRRSDVIVQDVTPDLLVYDQLRDAAHSLNAVTGYVYRHADGTRSVAEITTGLSTALGVAEDARLTEAALWQLECAHLLEPPVAEPAARRMVSRREAVRRFGTAALALATITSIAAPTPAMAKSSGSLGPKPPKGPPPGRPKGPPPGRPAGKNG